MAYKLGDLVVRITGDNSDFKKKAGETKKQAEDTGKSVGKSLDLMKVKTLALGVASTAVFVKTIGFLKDSAVAAINAQETFSKFDEVFQGMGNAAENAAKQFQDSFDLASVTAKEMLSDTGNLLTGFGATQEQALDLSVQINTLASDLASFTNYSGGAEGASRALTKAILGERESLKLLGIVIREEDINIKLAQKGQENLTGNALNLAKAQATLEIALEQGKNAIGDYARTHDSAANTLKRAGEETKALQVAIGTALMPSVAYLGKLWGTVAGALADVINKKNELREARRTEGTEEDTLENELKRRQALRTELQNTINAYKVYDEEGKLVRTAALEAAEAELAANEAVIKGLEIRIRQTALLENQSKSAKKSVEEWNETNRKAQTEEEQRLQAIADARKAIYDEFLAQTAELYWRTEQGLITEKEEREGIAQALREQIDSLYALYKETGDQSILTGEQMIEAIARLEEFKDSAADGVDELDALFKRLKENYANIVGELAGALGGLFTALYEKETAELDAQMQRRLEAEGLAEEDKIARLERERDAAIAAGDEVTASEKDAEAKRLKITEEFEKKKAKLKYESEKAQWALTLAMTIAEGARAIQVAATGAPWPFNLPAIAFATGISALQLAAVKASQPQPPAMATGGIAEPTNGGAVVKVAENNSGEVMFNTGETGQAFIQQMGAAIAANIEMTAIFQTESEKLAEIVVRPINDGRVRLNR
jgi:hypothetical protein